jgi:hypothetical protein
MGNLRRAVVVNFYRFPQGRQSQAIRTPNASTRLRRIEFAIYGGKPTGE